MEAEPGSLLYFANLLLAEIFNSEFLFYFINAFILIGLLVLSAVVSGSEIALFSLSSEECKTCKESDISAERTAVWLLEQPYLLLATILIFNNLVNVAIVTISTYVTWQVVGSKTPDALVITTLTVSVTALLLFFGELLPKVYATQRNLAFIRRTVFVIRIAFTVFHPLALLLVGISSVIEKRIQKKGYKIHIEELPEFLDEMPLEDGTSEREREMLKGILNFGTITVKQIMTSRHSITAIDINTPFPKLIEEIRHCGYSRIPVYRDTIDKIEGILYVKDLLPFLNNSQENFQWYKFLHSGYPVPLYKKIDKLLKDFQERRVHMAIVVDEYGGTAGLITLEDIIEEIVGEINDEFDEGGEVLYSQHDERTYLMEARISLNDLSKALDIDPSTFDGVKGESESLGGLMLEMFSRMPKVNDATTYENFKFTITAASKRKIKVVQVELVD